MWRLDTKMFFSYFPKLLYPLDDSREVVTDIFRRVAPRDKFIVNETYLEKYVLKAGERPEDIAYQLYGDAELHWVILLLNNIIDPYNEWYYTPEQVEAMVKQRYGENNANATNHWASTDRPEICVDYDAEKLASGEIFEVSHLEHELIENDARQEIKILHPRYLNNFVTEFRELIKQ